MAFQDFYRSKVSSKASQVVEKVHSLYPRKLNSFIVEHDKKRMVSDKMENVSFSDPTKVTFTYESVNYSFLVADIVFIKRVRTKKFLFRVSTLTEVV